MKRRAGGFIIAGWIGDHNPPHVHVYENGRLVAKFNTRDKVFMLIQDGYRNRVLKALRTARVI